ncbi:unnamed protein product [Closterium sp. NIES-65]|nr:unnamed protein product [Closterium sp. NIES-65]
MRGAPLGAGSRSSPLFITDASHRDNFAAEAAALRRVGPKAVPYLIVFAHEISSSKGAHYIHRTVFKPLAPGEIQQARGVNTTAPPRHPHHRGNGTVAAGNRTKGGHPSKGHHRGNGTAAGGAKRGNGTAAGGPKRGNGTAAGGAKRGNGTAAGGPKRGNGTAAGGAKRGNGTAAGGPKRGNGSANGNAPNNQKNSGAQPNKNGGGSANKPRRPKQIAEETCSRWVA